MADGDKRVVWAPRARRDIREIWLYFARIASPDVADEISREIHRVGARLGIHPLMGRPRDELVPGLRSILVHPHIIFYRVSDRVEIARVLHQRRDLGSVLSGDNSDATRGRRR